MCACVPVCVSLVIVSWLCVCPPPLTGAMFGKLFGAGKGRRLGAIDGVFGDEEFEVDDAEFDDGARVIIVAASGLSLDHGGADWGGCPDFLRDAEPLAMRAPMIQEAAAARPMAMPMPAMAPPMAPEMEGAGTDFAAGGFDGAVVRAMFPRVPSRERSCCVCVCSGRRAADGRLERSP